MVQALPLKLRPAICPALDTGPEPCRLNLY